tara:strand:- start:535 stop:1074 length:540 start_codon:yes stop_codon:yes gene_type:complete
MLRQIIATGCVAVFFAGPTFAGEATVTINKISSDGIGAAIGTIILKDGHHGLKVTPNLHDLPAGNHAFHMHENPDCGPGMKTGKKVAGLKAGGHYNPTGVGHGHGHGKKHGHGHGMMPHGDLPDITAGTDGRATKAVMSDKLKLAEVRGRSIMVHRYGTNDPGKPKGGGPRYACGVIPK